MLTKEQIWVKIQEGFRDKGMRPPREMKLQFNLIESFRIGYETAKLEKRHVGSALRDLVPRADETGLRDLGPGKRSSTFVPLEGNKNSRNLRPGNMAFEFAENSPLAAHVAVTERF